MMCGRCGGMMVPDRLLDDVGLATLSIWRCVCCGEILDSVIAVNRDHPPAARRLRMPKLLLRVRLVR